MKKYVKPSMEVESLVAADILSNSLGNDAVASAPDSWIEGE